jgi:hypothetical protein
MVIIFDGHNDKVLMMVIIFPGFMVIMVDNGLVGGATCPS